MVVLTLPARILQLKKLLRLMGMSQWAMSVVGHMGWGVGLKWSRRVTGRKF